MPFASIFTHQQDPRSEGNDPLGNIPAGPEHISHFSYCLLCAHEHSAETYSTSYSSFLPPKRHTGDSCFGPFKVPVKTWHAPRVSMPPTPGEDLSPVASCSLAEQRWLTRLRVHSAPKAFCLLLPLTSGVDLSRDKLPEEGGACCGRALLVRLRPGMFLPAVQITWLTCISISASYPQCEDVKSLRYTFATLGTPHASSP